MNSLRIGPGPLRTARGAGRRDAADFLVAGLFGAAFFWAGLRAVVLLPWPDARDRDPDVPELDLRDRGGEDVRVAMLANLLCSHTSHISPTPYRCNTSRRAIGSWRPRRQPESEGAASAKLRVDQDLAAVHLSDPP